MKSGYMRNRQKKIQKYGQLLPFLLLGASTLFFCWFFAGRLGIFGSKVDWISQHSVIPDYFRQQFYETVSGICGKHRGRAEYLSFFLLRAVQPGDPDFLPVSFY